MPKAKTFNLTKNTPANFSKFMSFKNVPNETLPAELKEKFLKDNYILGKGHLFLTEKPNYCYVGDIVGHYVQVEYKKDKNALCVIYKNDKQQQKLYVIEC